MLTVTPNIFQDFGHVLDLAEAPEQSKVFSGVLIPSAEECDQSSSGEASRSLQDYLSQNAVAEIFLFVLQSAWQSDSPRMRHLGLKPDLSNYECLKGGIAAERMLTNELGEIRFCGLVGVESEVVEEALSYMSSYQRYSFLIISFQTEDSPELQLAEIVNTGLNYHLKSKKTPYFDWARLAEQASHKDGFFVASVGWNEEHGDLRYLVIGDAEGLERSICAA